MLFAIKLAFIWKQITYSCVIHSLVLSECCNSSSSVLGIGGFSSELKLTNYVLMNSDSQETDDKQ